MEILPLDCEAVYHPGVLSTAESRELLEELCASFDVRNRDMLMADGSVVQLETGGFTFADEDLLGFDKLPKFIGQRAGWFPSMRSLKRKVEAIAGSEFQVCRAVYYENGEVGVDYHSDLPAFGDTSLIASVSLGEEREFVMRPTERPDDVFSIVLGDGSVLLMGEHCQERYQHALPRKPKYKRPRINLTFRRHGWG